MKQSIKKTIKWIIFLAIALIFVYYIKSNLSDFKQLSLVNPQNLILIGILQILFLVNNGIMLKLFMSPFNINLKAKEWFGLSCITSFSNYFIPGIGGATSRGIYLKKKHEFSYAKFLGNLAGNYIIIFFTNSLIALISLILLKKYYNFWNFPLFFIFGGIFLVSLFFIIFHIKSFKSPIFRKINLVIEGWENVRRSKKLIIGTTTIGMLNIFIGALILFIEFRIFGIELSFLKSLIIAITAMLAIFINITPGGLGIKEGLIVLTSTILIIPTEISISVSIIDRAIHMLILFILGPIFSYILFKHKPKLLNQTDGN
jgi:uncharacterized membrane protein YbhN (UPF0104 family)